jgi:hypothetical protein
MRPSRFRLNHSHPLAQGLVFAGLGNNPGGGTLYDSSSKHNDATLYVSGQSWIYGVGRHGIRTTSGGGAENGADFTRSLAITDDWTASAWIRRNDVLDGLCAIIGQKGNDNSLIRVRRQPIHVYVDSVENTYEWPDVFSSGTWTHIVTRLTGSDLDLFVDGNKFGSTLDASGDTWSFSAYTRILTNWYDSVDCEVADTCVYARSLGLAEIRSLADPSNILLDGLIQPDATRTTVFGWTAPEEEEPEETPRVTTLSRPSIRPARFTLNTSHPLAQGLVFAGLGNHPGGDRMYDSSGYRRDGMFIRMDAASDWNITSKLGRASLDFDGSDKSVRITSAIIPANHTVAVSLWLYDREGNLQNWPVNSYGASELVIRQEAGQTVDFVLNSFSTNDRVEAGTAILNEWCHLVGQYDGTNLQIWQNGILLGSVVPTGSWNGANGFSLGVGSASFCDCRMADVLIHDRALTTSEIQSLADPSNILLDGLIEPDSTRTTVIFNSPVEEEPEEIPRVTTLSRPTVRPPRFSLNTSHPLAQGLVFAGLGNHPGGGTLYDSSFYGAARQLALPESVTWGGYSSASSIGRAAITFDGTSGDVIETTAGGDLGCFDITKPWTLAAWVNWSEINTSPLGISSSSTSEFVGIDIFNRYLKISTNGETPGNDTNEINLNQWYHVALEWTGSIFRIYCNAESRYSVAPSGLDWQSSDTLIIGTKGSTSSPEEMNGSIADILLIQGVLSSEMLSALADPSNILLDGLIQPHTPYYYTAPVVTIETLHSWSDIFRSPLFKSNLFIR